MLTFIDNLLNKVTMYRLLYYYLAALLLIAAFLGFIGVLPYSPISLAYTTAVLIVISWFVNSVFSRVFKAPTNVESYYLTALILALIITPVRPLESVGTMFLIWAAALAMASKYILAIRKKHIFNPAAFAVALTVFTIYMGASWWVGTITMLPFVVLGGLLIVRKIQRFDLVLGFLAAALATVVITSFGGGSPLISMEKAVVETPLLFFSFVMLTEPLTTPPKREMRVWYGALVGFLFAPAIHLGSIYSTPELALIVGNIFSYFVSPKEKYLLVLEEKIKIASDQYDFIFRSDRRVKFRPGQYLEWTLAHDRADNRGNRRYFTIASSPTEKEVRLGVKFYKNSSSFKSSMLSMKKGTQIVASQLAGEFILPEDENQKLVLIAGGIGVTPFRSMVKYLLDRGERRRVTLFYSNRTVSEVAYREVFDEAREKLGLKSVYTLTDRSQVPEDWSGYVGHIDGDMIAREVPDWRGRTFYISGSHAMVVAFESALKKMGVARGQIKTDFFPGFA